MKSKPSKLDPHAERLDEWFGIQKLSIAQVQEQLKLDGCVVSSGRLSTWWAARQSQQMQNQLLAQISTGSNQCKEVEKQLGKNPAPELETLVKLHRVLILKLSSQANVDPSLYEVVFNMMKPVLKYAELQEKRKRNDLDREIFETEVSEKLLDQALRAKADEINSSNMSNADKIAAMRREAFKSVDELQQSGRVKIPKQ